MRIFVFIWLGLLGLVAVAQERLISFDAQNESLISVFEALEQTYDLRFAFAVADAQGKLVSIHAEDMELTTFLHQLLAVHQLSFEIVDGNYVSVIKAREVLFRIEVGDAETGEPLSFATARINGTTQGYIADQNGVFEVMMEGQDSTVLEISFVGYEEKQIKMDSLNPLKTIAIALERNAWELQEVIVKEYLTKGISIDDQASRIRVDIQDMEILPGLSERDILLSAQQLAGIGSVDESAGGLNVRGSSRDNSFLYWNNIPVYQPAHYFGNISAFIPSGIGKVDIFKNYIPVTYGGASSGLLLLNSRKPKGAEAVVETNLNQTHGDLYWSMPFADYRGQLSIGARRSFNDVIATPTFNSISDKLFDGSLTEDVQSISDDFEYNSQLVFSDINVVADFASRRNNFSLSFLRSNSKLDYASEDEESIFESLQQHDVKTVGANASWVRRWTDQVSTEWSNSIADYQMNYSLVNNRNDEDERENDLQSRTNDLLNVESRFKATYAPTTNHAVDLGYQFNAIDAGLVINEDFFFEEDFRETIDSEGLVHAFFGNYFGKFRSGVQIGAGLRLNRYAALQSQRLDRQLRLNYEIAPGLLLKSTAGVYHQYISSLKELDFVFSNTLEQNWVTANDEEDIPIIKNEQLVLGALLTRGGWVVDLDGYFKRVLAPVAWNFGFRPEDDEVLTSGVERITGLDLTIKRRWRYYRAWLSYAFQDSEVSALEERFPSGLNGRHQLQLSQTLNYKEFEFSLGYTFRSGLPFTNATGFEEIVPEDDPEDRFYEINYEPLNSNRLPNYHRVDVSAWYKFKGNPSSRFSGEIGFAVLNVLNRTNRMSRNFSIEEDENDQIFLLRNERSLIGITPNLSVRLKF